MKHTRNIFRYAFLTLVLLSALPVQAKKIRVLMHMTSAQGAFFKDSLCTRFEEQTGHSIEITNAKTIDEIPWLLKMNRGRFNLVKIPFIHAWSLVDSGYIKPLDSFLPSDEVETFKKEYLLTFFGRKELFQYLLPRKFETRILAYRKSMVELARKELPSMRDSINAALKTVNGYGMPSNYALEISPDLWDDFDIFALGYIWSRIEIDSLVKPRIAFRSAPYSGTALRIFDRAVKAGADSLSVLTMSGDEVADQFHWEAALSYCGILSPFMTEGALKGDAIWRGFRSGDVFLSFMTQVDCFSLVGNPNDSLDGYVKDDDLGVALIPTGASLMLNDKGHRIRVGNHGVTTGGWWWGIPENSPNPDISYEFYRFITSNSVQKKECMEFGMIPVRQDLVTEKKLLFDMGKRSEILQKSYAQLQKNGNNVICSQPRLNQIIALYSDAWNDIVYKKNWAANQSDPPDWDFIAKRIAMEYSSRAKKILGIKEPLEGVDTEPATRPEAVIDSLVPADSVTAGENPLESDNVQ